MRAYTVFKVFGTLTCPRKIGGFYLLTQKNEFNKINCDEMLWMVFHLWPSISLILWKGNVTTSFLNSRDDLSQRDQLDMGTYGIGVLPLIK